MNSFVACAMVRTVRKEDPRPGPGPGPERTAVGRARGLDSRAGGDEAGRRPGLPDPPVRRRIRSLAVVQFVGGPSAGRAPVVRGHATFASSAGG